MKNYSMLKLLALIILASTLLIACDDDEPEEEDEVITGPSTETIPIDENSAFNMSNFVKSFDQLFVSHARWMWDFDHEYTNGIAYTSYQNMSVIGGIGDKIFTINHNVNDNIIESSDRDPSEFEGNIVSFTYDYDLEGYITKLTKESNGQVRDIVEMAYNDDGQLITKTHVNQKMGGETTNSQYIITPSELFMRLVGKNVPEIKKPKSEYVERFTYNSDGLVKSYTRYDYDSTTYTYQDGKMVKEINYYDGQMEYTHEYEYDGQGRMLKWIDLSSEYHGKVEYSTDYITMYSYEGDLLMGKADIGMGYTFLREWEYTYGEDNTFEYCRVKENDEEGYTAKKMYYEGTVENLELIGYTEIDSRDPASNKKTKESVYLSDGTQLYYAEFEVDGGSITATNWYLADGTPITESDIEESWVFILVR